MDSDLSAVKENDFQKGPAGRRRYLPQIVPAAVVALILLATIWVMVPLSLVAQPAPGNPAPAPGANPPPDPADPNAPADPGADPAPLAPDPDTVLLRENWTENEAQRIRGMAHRISRVLESPAEKVPLRDSFGRKFDMDYNGRIRFNPLDDNWKPVIPNVNEVAFHLAEADGLRKFGLKDEALGLWKSVRAMGLFIQNPPAHVKQAAAAATKKINEMRTGDPDFAELDRATDPYIFYHEKEKTTYLLSDVYGWRVRLPGRYRLARAPQPESDRRSESIARDTVYLQQGELTLVVSADLWNRGWKIPDVAAYARIWDLRRSLNPQRKQIFGFRREPHPQGDRCRPGRLDKRLAPDGLARCAVYQTFLARRGQEFHSMEFFHLRPFIGFLLEVRFKQEAQDGADVFLQEFLNTVVFSSR